MIAMPRMTARNFMCDGGNSCSRAARRAIPTSAATIAWCGDYRLLSNGPLHVYLGHTYEQVCDHVTYSRIHCVAQHQPGPGKWIRQEAELCIHHERGCRFLGARARRCK